VYFCGLVIQDTYISFTKVYQMLNPITTEIPIHHLYIRISFTICHRNIVSCVSGWVLIVHFKLSKELQTEECCSSGSCDMVLIKERYFVNCKINYNNLHCHKNSWCKSNIRLVSFSIDATEKSLFLGNGKIRGNAVLRICITQFVWYWIHFVQKQSWE